MKDDDAAWLAAFHAGERWALEQCYRTHAARVAAAARGVLGPVDAETVTHEVFYRLLSDARMRGSFRGGNLGAWLTQVATHSAIDDLRKRRRESAMRDEVGPNEGGPDDTLIDEEVEARIAVERFRKEHLQPGWEGVFDARFLRQLTQRDAARELGIPRSTLIYQEQRIREALRRFLLEGEDSMAGARAGQLAVKEEPEGGEQ